MVNSDYAALAGQEVLDLRAYAARPPHPEQIGGPLSPEWFRTGLDKMREALSAPYALILADGESHPGQVLTRGVVIVADNRDEALIASDPIRTAVSLSYGDGLGHSLYRTFAETPLDAFWQSEDFGVVFNSRKAQQRLR